MKHITKKLRENAALLCAIASSNEGFGLANAEFFLDLDPKEGAFEVAFDAWRAANRAYPKDTEYEVIAAEAEAMLRTGWVP